MNGVEGACAMRRQARGNKVGGAINHLCSEVGSASSSLVVAKGDTRLGHARPLHNTSARTAKCGGILSTRKIHFAWLAHTISHTHLPAVWAVSSAEPEPAWSLPLWEEFEV